MFDRINFLSICFLFTILFWGGCINDNLPDEQEEQEAQEEWPTGQNVFVAGFENNQDEKPVARLWKNGKMVNLTGIGKDVRSSGDVVYSEARSVFVSGNDVYAVGRDVANNSNAVLWKNGEMEKLTNGNNSARAYSVYVSQDDVYVSGSEGLEARLWKNGTIQNIADNKDAIVFFSVFISNGDVYTSGYVTIEGRTEGNLHIPGYLKATIWRNGKKLNLHTEGRNNSHAMSIFVK